MNRYEIERLRVRYAPTMLYPPARAAFERALNAKATSGTEVPRSEDADELPLNEKLFAPVLDQWHPGQPHLVEFIMKRPDSDNAAGAVQNIVALAGAGYKTEAEQASGLTGLQLEYHPPSQQAAMAGQAESALNSLRVRFVPTMLYPPARAAFEAALNSKAKKPGFVGTESRSVYAEATPLPSSRGYAEAGRNSGESEPPLNAGELAALKALGGELNAEQVAADAEYAAREMMAGLRGKQRRGREVARNSEASNEAEFILEFESLEIQPARDRAENCNQHGHDADCTVSITAENLRKTSAGKSLQGVMDELKANPAHPSDIPVTLNQANQRTVEKVQELCGRDISQHVHSISPSALHHARKGHPDLNDEEVMLMLDIHDNWDELTYEVRSNTPKLKYSKTYDGQSYTVVERIGRTPRTKGKTRHLHFTTEFKND